MSRNWRTYLSLSQEGQLERAVLRARFVLFLQRLWQVLLWPLMVAGLFVLLVLTGVLPALPPLVRFPVLIALAGLFFWLLIPPLLRLRFPTEQEGLARLEEISGLEHQPLRTLRDEPATPPSVEAGSSAREATLSLWQAHHDRLRKLVGSLRAGWPRSDAPRRDPYALRFGLALALIATFALNGAHFADNLRATLRPPSLNLARHHAYLDAWLDPPSFVRTPPVVLAVNGEVMHAEEVVKVHQGSRLELRYSGPRPPEVSIHEFDPASGQVGRLLKRERLERLEGDSWRLRLRLERPVRIVVSGPVAASWRLHVLADLPPSISLVRPPAAGPGGALVVAWRASDDHGVKSARAIFRLHEPPGGMLEFDPPKVRLKVLRPGKKVTGRDLVKLMAHPWAGMRVRMRLEATDVMGQKGHSRLHVLTLPTRPFSQLMARAIIEQRRELILHPDRKDEVAEVLMALLAWPQGMLRDSGAYLGLRQAAVSLLRARTETELKRIVTVLWMLAEDIEDGDVAAARRRLEAARKALEEALRKGASEEEISRRVAELKEAVNDYLSKLARQRLQQGQPRPGRQGEWRLLRPQDLRRMLDRVERLARGGARDAAQRLLSQLDEILQGLQAMPRMAAPSSPQGQALDEMRKLMREQQRLLDETWRRAHEPLLPGQPREGEQRAMPDLQHRQQQLAESLNRMREQLERMVPPEPLLPPAPERRQHQGQQGQQGRGWTPDEQMQGRMGQRHQWNRQGGGGNEMRQGRRSPGSENGQPGSGDGQRQTGRGMAEALKEAERAMKGAARNLGRGNLTSALRQQHEALQALRQGARELARQLRQQQGGQGGGMSFGFMRRQYDPLGRPLRGRYLDAGPDENMVPDENTAERARRILEYLRKRAEDATRPPLERNYFQRLLKGIY